MDFETSLAYVKHQVGVKLIGFIGQRYAEERLRDAMLYATQGNGKYIRSFLIYAFAQRYRGSIQTLSSLFEDQLFSVCAALEMIHSYSLVHDDLPAMDNAQLRRGHPSCWVAYDEAIAILVGDGLLTLSFEVLSTIPDLSDSVKLELIRLFAQASGPEGMVAGQMMDLYPPLAPSYERVLQMQNLKTGALFGLACEVGVLLAGAKDHRESAWAFGQKLGLLFQMTDDLLDNFGNQEQEGKTLHHDQDKVTFITLLGIEGVKQQIMDLNQLLREDLFEKDEASFLLLFLLDFLMARVRSLSDIAPFRHC